MIVTGQSHGEFEQAPAGTHVARCVRLVDLGTQEGEYEGRPTFRRQVVITWELPTELMTEGETAGQPFIVSKFYTRSLNENSALHKHLVTWRGRAFTAEELEGFDLEAILGAPCMVSVTHSERGKARVDAVIKLPKNVAAPKQVNPSFVFDLDAFDQVAYDSLSDWFRETIARSPEYKKLSEQKTAPAAPDDCGDVDLGGFDDEDGVPF